MEALASVRLRDVVVVGAWTDMEKRSKRVFTSKTDATVAHARMENLENAQIKIVDPTRVRLMERNSLGARKEKDIPLRMTATTACVRMVAQSAVQRRSAPATGSSPAAWTRMARCTRRGRTLHLKAKLKMSNASALSRINFGVGMERLVLAYL